MSDKKLRVWWIPAVGRVDVPFYIPVSSPEEAKRMLDTLSAYDIYLENEYLVSADANTGGLEMLDENGEWVDWECDGYDDLDEYIEEKSKLAAELESFGNALFEQVK